MPTVTVSRKGWVVIPKEIRERHGIRPGDRVEVVDDGGVITIVVAPEDPIGMALGRFREGPSLTEALLAERRREREREEAAPPPPAPEA